jgi:hypothetical protein
VQQFLVAAIAADQYPTKWFSTGQVLDHLPSIDRTICAPITNALNRAAAKDLFERRKVGGRWRFRLTPKGQAIGAWALEHAGAFDKDVQLYTLRHGEAEWEKTDSNLTPSATD